MTWSDGVFQSELALAPGPMRQIAETERQLSSCPRPLRFDGRHFAFVTDLLGVGGIGHADEPRRLRPAASRARTSCCRTVSSRVRNGRYELKITEPMEEAAYVDSVRLVAYDLPPGWSMVLDERKAISAPEATGRSALLPRGAAPGPGCRRRGRGRDARGHRRRRRGRAAGPHRSAIHRPHGGSRPHAAIRSRARRSARRTRCSSPTAGSSIRMRKRCSRRGRQERPIWRRRRGARRGRPMARAATRVRISCGHGATHVGAARPAAARDEELRTAHDTGNLLGSPGGGVRASRNAAVGPHSLPLASARLASGGFPRREMHAWRRPSYDYDRRAPLWDTRYPRGLLHRSQGPSPSWSRARTAR